MTADLMDEDMGDDGAERLLVLRPIVEDGATVVPDGVGKPACPLAAAALRQPDAFEQARKLKRVVDAQTVQRAVVGKFRFDPGRGRYTQSFHHWPILTRSPPYLSRARAILRYLHNCVRRCLPACREANVLINVTPTGRQGRS